MIFATTIRRSARQNSGHTHFVKGPFLACWIGFFATAYGVEPKAVISGPKAAKPGTMVVLASEGSVYDQGGLAWTFVDGKCQAIEALNGQLAFVQGEPGNVVVALVAVGLDTGNKPKIALAKWIVVIGDTPGPTPPPVPPNPVPPGPQPNPAPDDRFHLAAVAQNAGSSLPVAARALLPAIADNFTASAAAATNGQITTVIGLNTDVYTRNQKTMGTAKKDFAPLSDALQAALQAANLTTLVDGVQAYKEIAWGLKQVK